MRFTILGGLTVTAGDQRLDPGPPKQRLVLAVLLGRLGEPVPAADLMDALWGEHHPASAGGNLRLYIHQLRRLLGPDRIVRDGSSYRLHADPAQVDVRVFADHAARGADALVAGDYGAARDALRAAQALWRGLPYAGLDDEPALAPEIARWVELRSTVLEHRFAAELALGAGSGLVAELTAAAVEQPYRERFRAQLMTALYRAGRRADALSVYRDARALLIAELGIEPGAELAATHQAVLRDDAALLGVSASPSTSDSGSALVGREEPDAVPGPPAQLPATPRHFSGRTAELARLTGLTRPDDGPATPLVVVVGPPGVGKTALVVRWAHDAAERYPDGLLFLDLRGFHRDRPMRPAEAIAHLLISLGVPAEDLPPTLADGVARYRSLLAGKRVLVVLDNAKSAEQVRDLLPGTASAAVLVTSRHRLPALVAGYGARQLALGTLSPDEAVRLMARVLDDDRVGTEPAAATALADACGRLPLALCVAAANLAENPARAIAAHLAELRRDRLAALEVDGDGELGLAAAFDLSYDALPAADQRAFRLLGVFPGEDFTDAVVTVLIGDPAERVLGRLVRQHLVEARAGDRFALHDLVREYARRRAAASDPAEVAAALARLDAYVLRVGYAAAWTLYPQLLRIPPEWERPPEAELPTSAEALAWVHSELSNLVAHAADATARGAHEVTYRIGDFLRGYFWAWRRDPEWPVLGALHVAAAAADGNLAAEAVGELSLGNYHFRRREEELAREHYSIAADRSIRAGWVRGQAAAESGLGTVLSMIGELEQSVKHFEASLEALRRGGEQPLPATYLNLAGSLVDLGRLADAADLCQKAIAAFAESGGRNGRAQAISNLAWVLGMQGNVAESRECAEEALRISADLGRCDTQAEARLVLAMLCRQSGDLAGALQHAGMARELSVAMGDGYRESMADNAIGEAYLALGRPAEALERFRTALDQVRGLPARAVELEALIGVATAHADLGDRAAAREHAEQALATARAFGFRPMAERALAALNQLA